MDTKPIKLELDPSIIEKNLLITDSGSGSGELDSLFPKHDEIKSKLIQPAPVTMSEEVKLELKEENKDNEVKPEVETTVIDEVKEDPEPVEEEVKKDDSLEDAEIENEVKPEEKNEAENELTLEFDDAELLTEDIKVIDDIDNKVGSTEKNEKTETKKDNSENDKLSSGRNLWVSGLSHLTRAADLKKHFLSQGRVIGAKIVSNSRSPGARCYGYIVMSSSEEADKCVKNLHHSKLLKRFISVRKSKNEKIAEIVNEKHEENSPEKKQVEEVKSKTEEPKKSRHSPRPNSRKRDSKEAKPERDSKSERDRERERHIERNRRLREKEREKERVRVEQRRLRDLQVRQREEAIRLDREKQELRMERERLQREKMELIALEKQQLEKEREEIRRQKRKIEDERRRKELMLRHAERTKRHRSPMRRSPPDVPSKLLRKTDTKYKETERRYPDKRKDPKFKEPNKEEYRYKGGEYTRGMEMKYERYPDEKKSMREDVIKAGPSMGFEPPPPRISSNDVNHFNVGFQSSSNRFREEFHGKDPFTASRNVDRVSDRFPIDRHERNDMEMVHRSRSGYQPEMEFSKPEARVPMSSSSRPERMDSRMGSRDNVPMERSNGRYQEGDRDMRHRGEPWYDAGQKRVGPSAPSREGSSWVKGNHVSGASWSRSGY